MSNTIYIKQKDGSYKKVVYAEKTTSGSLDFVDSRLEFVGPEGQSGTSGTSGLSGTSGSSGSSGVNGTSGSSGINGLDGLDGENGTSGTSGIDGQNGLDGTSGTSGVDGQNGLDGTSGSSGSSGLSGTSGSSGVNGLSGSNGTSGINGLNGSSGTSGISIVGATGATGPAGKQGERGERGFPGMSGGRGRDGGAYQLRFVDEDKVIPAGHEQVAYDLFIVNTLTIEGATKQFMFGSASISNEALLNVKEDVWIDGTLNVFGKMIFDYKHQIKHYGSWYDTTTQTNLGATYANVMTFNTPDIEDGVVMTNGSKITFTQKGIYNIQFSAQIDKTDSGSDEVEIWIAKNGQNLPWTSTKLELVGNNAEYAASWNFMVEADANEYVQLLWHSNDINMRILSRPAETNPDRPEIPSIILTVEQV